MGELTHHIIIILVLEIYFRHVIFNLMFARQSVIPIAQDIHF